METGVQGGGGLRVARYEAEILGPNHHVIIIPIPGMPGLGFTDPSQKLSIGSLGDRHQ